MISIAVMLFITMQSDAQEKQQQDRPSQSIQRAIEAKDALFKKLSGKLKDVLSTKGPTAAIEVCGKEAVNIARSIGEEHDLKIGRTALKLRNPKNQAPKWAKPLLKNAKEKPLFQSLPGDRTGALFPIKLKAQCLICHGEPVFIPSDVKDALKKRYPKDKATGFKVDDLRGWFWVEVKDNETPKTQSKAVESTWIQYGKMHEVIGQKNHHGRVALNALTAQEHVYAVGALEGLQGEITILDSVPYVTSIHSNKKLTARSVTENLQATLLLGAKVSKWQETVFTNTLGSDKWESHLEKEAHAIGLNTDAPIMYLVKGTFKDVTVHVINGACPIHAQLHGEELPSQEAPHQRTISSIQGTMVGFFAKASTGRLTHPGTSVHAHLIYQSPDTGQWLTGHIEQASITSGSKLSLPIQ